MDRAGWALAAAGLCGSVTALIVSPGQTRAAAAQMWSPFVLVAGLLLIGLVADRDRLFAAVGQRLAKSVPTGMVLFVGVAIMICIVTALLNLDTAVAFLTPVLVYTARSRGEDGAPLLYLCILLANAGSLFLPGSNLTNLIVLGHLHLTGRGFLDQTWAPGLASVFVTAAVVWGAERKALRARSMDMSDIERPVLGVGLTAVLAATILVLLLRSPALPIAVVGLGAAAVHVAIRRMRPRDALDALGLPLLVGLFGVAVFMGTLGRAWSGPETLLSHLDVWGTAAVSAVSTVLINNLPASALLASHVPPHPFALLVGLNLGPNLFATGSLAWLLWLRSACAAGAEPSLARAARLGTLAVPLSIVAALGVLVLVG